MREDRGQKVVFVLRGDVMERRAVTTGMMAGDNVMPHCRVQAVAV